jgi:hypothetical protein
MTSGSTPCGVPSTLGLTSPFSMTPAFKSSLTSPSAPQPDADIVIRLMEGRKLCGVGDNTGIQKRIWIRSGRITVAHENTDPL